jgi:hypothetical protein
MMVLNTMRDRIKLADLKVLALDGQATGANPDRGHLLEIGWIPGCAASSSNSPAGRYLPLQALTGHGMAAGKILISSHTTGCAWSQPSCAGSSARAAK